MKQFITLFLLITTASFAQQIKTPAKLQEAIRVKGQLPGEYIIDKSIRIEKLSPTVIDGIISRVGSNSGTVDLSGINISITGINNTITGINLELNKKVVYIETIASLTATSGSSVSTSLVKEDGRGGVFNWFPNSANLTVDNGVIFQAPNGYWVRDITNNTYKGEWFGLKGNNTSETSIVNSIINSIPNNSILELPKSKTNYLLGYIGINKSITIRGNGSKIIQASATNVFDVTGSWGAINNVNSITTSAESVSNTNYPTRLTVKLTLSTTPVDLAVNDIVKIYSSNDIPQARFVGRKLGEFAKIAKITGNDIYLQADLRDRILYTTGIKIARLNKINVKIEGFEFEKASGLTGNGSSVGNDAFIRISSAVKPVLRDIKVTNSISNAIVFWSCYGYLADNVNAEDLPDNQDSDQYGYAIVDAQSEYGTVQNCTWTNTRHGFTTNTYAAGQTTPNAYGRSAYFTVSNCQAIGGLYSGFDTHDEAIHGTFTNCRHVGANYRVLPATVAIPVSFNSRGCFIKFINCDAINGDIGFGVQSSNVRNGGDVKSAWSTGNEFINCHGYNLSRFAFQIERGVNTIINGGYFEDRVDALSESFLQIELSDVTIDNVFIKNYAPANNIGVFALTNADLKTNNLSIDISYAALNGSSQVINFNNSLVVILANSNANQRITMRKTLLNTGDRPINALISNVSGQSTNTFAIIDGLEMVRNSGTITTSNSTVLNRGGLTVGNAITGLATANAWIRDFYQMNPTALASTSTFAYSTRSSSTTSPTTTDPATWFQYRGDQRVIIDVTPSVNISLGSFPLTYYRGQIFTIRNNSTVNTILITNTATRIIEGGDLTVAPLKSASFFLDGTNYKYIN